jgi:hypothetical protein
MIRTIKDCSCGKRCEGNTDHCSSCNRLLRKADKVTVKDAEPIQKVSEKQGKLLSIYARKKARFVKGKKCQGRFSHDCSGPLTIHHMQGRVGYADEWARENDETLLTDERFWMCVCLEAHKYIEEHPKFAFENQYSFKRITDPIFQKQ